MIDKDSRSLALVLEWGRTEYQNEGQKEAALQVLINTALQEQDKLTRYACAKAILKCPEDMSTSGFKVTAVSACLHVIAV